MESVRARIFFSESLSDQTLLTHVKSMILVPRNKFPRIGVLKEHIRNKFSISDEQDLELSIDGFTIPDWENTEVIRENDVICVDATKASSHTCSPTFVEETNHKKKKRKRSGGSNFLNCDSESGIHKVAKVVHDVQDGTPSKKKKKIHHTSKKKKKNETSISDEEEDKVKTKHKKKDKKKAEDRIQRQKKDSDQSKPKEDRQMRTLERNCNEEPNQTEFSKELTNDIVADGSKLQASISTAKQVEELMFTQEKTRSNDVPVNGTSTATELTSGVGDTCNIKGSTHKKRRRRRRKRKSNKMIAENHNLLDDTPNGGIAKPDYSLPANRNVKSDRVKNSAAIVNEVQNERSVMPKDDFVAITKSGGHIVFESESDGESDTLKSQPSEPHLETMQSEEMAAKGTLCAADNVVTQPDQQHQETEVGSGIKVVRNEDEAVSFDCPTPPGADDDFTGEKKDVEARNYETYPSLNGPPRNGDIIAFKVLELSSDYCPEVSEYKEGVVTEFNPGTQYVGIQLTKGPTSNKKLPDTSEGRFEMELDDEWTTDRNQQKSASLINVLLTSMIEPKLLSV